MMEEGENVELKRDIYAELLKWKNKNSGKVLELKGARQAGRMITIPIYLVSRAAFDFERRK